MTKSRCETDLDKMTDERNYWRALAKERGEEIRQLRNRVDRQSVMTGAITQGALPRLGEAYERLQDERDALKIEVAARGELLDQTLPGSVFFNMDIEPGTVHLGVILVGRYGNEPGEWKVNRFDAIYRGTYEDAVNTVFLSAGLAAMQVPAPVHLLPKDGTLPGWTKSDLFDLLHALAPASASGNRAEFERIRNEGFDSHWALMERAIRENNLKTTTRNSAHTQFNTVIDNAFTANRADHTSIQNLLEHYREKSNAESLIQTAQNRLK